MPTYAARHAPSPRAQAYGDALKALGAARPEVVALDGEVSNSTYAETFAKAFPDRFFEQYIAEQQTGRRRGRAPGARLRAVRLDVRRVLQPRL